MSNDSPQPPLLQDFYQELIRASLHYRNLGLAAENRCSAFITSGLAVADIQFQEDMGRTMNEEEFVVLARTVHRAVRKGIDVSGGPPS